MTKKLSTLLVSILFVLLTTIPLDAEVKPWISLSTLWGQGDMGIAYKNTSIRYNFVLDISDFDFEYHETSTSIRTNDYTLGFKYRRQLNQNEYTPYLGYFIPFYFKYPISIYNELEYRINSVVKEEDYVRTRHILTLYMPKSFEEKYFIRPYIAFDSYIDWEDKDFEKNRLNLGYMFTVSRLRARIYAYPWIDGTREQSWDDQSRFGATVTYLW